MDWFSEFGNAALQGLGLDTGTNAAKTIGGVINSSRSPEQTTTTAIASATPTTHLYFGMTPGKAALVAIGVLVVAYIVLKKG